LECAVADDGAVWRDGGELVKADLVFGGVDDVGDARSECCEVARFIDVEFEYALLHSWAEFDEKV